MATNPNWPLVELAWGSVWTCNSGDSPLDRYTDLTNRTRASASIRRGRQYELDQVRAGEAELILASADGALDPSNTTGPWAGHIAPYQPIRLRAQYPPTVNLLTPVQATAEGIATGIIPGGNSGIDIFSGSDSTGGSIVASGTAWQGSQVFQFSVPSGSAALVAIAFSGQVAVEPGVTYAQQMRVRNITASTSLSVRLFMQWLDPSAFAGHAFAENDGTPVTLTGSPTAAWSQLTLTATAPSTTGAWWYGLEVGATAAATCTIQVDGWQIERASAPSTFTVPGTAYPIYGGYMERWPQTWDLSGTYGLVQATAVDAFALLSQVILSDPLTSEINSRSPNWLYTLGDPSESSSFADASGQNPPATTGVSKYGAGTLTSGNAITAANLTSGVYQGSSGTVVTFNNPNPGLTLSSATYISLTNAGITGPADPTLFTRMFAFRTATTAIPTNESVLWSAMDDQRGTDPDGAQYKINIDNTGALYLLLAGPNGVQSAFPFGAGNVCDSNWHLVIVSLWVAQGILTITVDTTSNSFTVTASQAPSGMIGESLGTFCDLTDGNGCANNFNGDMSFVAEFPNYFSSTDLATIYAAWRSACAGESSGARYSRILRYADYTGPAFVDTGTTTNMGPATDISGSDAVSALQAVVDTENGAHFVDRSGNVTFQARTRRYNQNTPAVTFGDSPTAGEMPYEDLQLDYDPTHLANIVQITQHSTNQVFSSTDETSKEAYFPRTLTRDSNAALATECQAAADYLISRYRQPAMRVQSLVVRPSSTPSLWPTALGLDLSQRIRVNHRPPAAPMVSVDCFTESVNAAFDDGANAVWTLQCSPADPTPYGVFASFHTTLSASASSGQATIHINHGQDNVNKAAAQLAQGQTLILDIGTANQETVTIKTVGATSSGWSTATITLTANLAHTHASGAVVCEPLPTGTTDPTTWDASAKFDSMAFSY